MTLGRSPLSFAPILGVVLVLLLAGSSHEQRLTTVHIPREFHGETCCHCPENLLSDRVASIAMHADGSIEIATPYGRDHVDPPDVAATLEALRPDPPCELPFIEGLADQNHVQLQVDDSVPWGNFVEMVSSVRHTTGVEVLVAADDD